MTRRVVRFQSIFFDILDGLLPEERTPEGGPSVADFLFYELPAIRDLLAENYEAVTAQFPDNSSTVRIFVGAGVMVERIALFTTLNDSGTTVEVLDIDIEPF